MNPTNTNSRTINTGLMGSVNLEILQSVSRQLLSDGVWENSPSMKKYWENFDIEMANNFVVLQINDGYDSSFRGKTNEEVLNWFADKIKAVAKMDLKDNSRSTEKWDRLSTYVLSYMGNHTVEEVTISDCYKAYDILKSRSTKVYADDPAILARKNLIASKNLEIEAAQKLLNKLISEKNAL